MHIPPVTDTVDAIIEVCDAATERGEHLSGRQIYTAVLEIYPDTSDQLFGEAVPIAAEKLREQGRRLNKRADDLRAIDDECQIIARETGIACFPRTPLNAFLNAAIATGNRRAAHLLARLRQPSQ